ncbi:hypothetical protein BC826DRAFT_261638 [Russula brevipes]|nr:hypothetical protein BC826DRAFT_261638 [Russula brevipes]
MGLSRIPAPPPHTPWEIALFFLLTGLSVSAPPSPLISSRTFLCEGPDQILRMFWWHRLTGGHYDVSLSSCDAVTFGLHIRSDTFFGGTGNALQLYAAHQPDVVIGLFRRHQPPEPLAVGDNYATFYFTFSHQRLLLHALLALSLNRWLDLQDGHA